MAPEMNGANAYDGPSVDIYAMGVMLFIMCTGNFPFSPNKPAYY